MIKVLRMIMRHLLRYFDLYSLYLLWRNGAPKKEGWFLSFKLKKSVNLGGEPIPWITYSCIDFLISRLKKDFVVFEYGSGNSSYWWASNVGKLISCEHNLSYYNEIVSHLPSNVEYIYCPLDKRIDGMNYCQQCLKFKNLLDILVIDGRDRVNCAKNGVNALKQNGVIVWDNTDRDSYKEGMDYLMSVGFKRIDFTGMTPIQPTKSQTSIFYKSNNCLFI